MIAPCDVRVLVVDDERNIADSLVLILRAKQYQARAVYSAEEAMVAAEIFKPHAVISDVIMGKATGIDLALYLEAQEPGCKVLLISGNSIGLGLVQDALRRGYFHTILTKPVHPEQILAFLATCAPQTRRAN